MDQKFEIGRSFEKMLKEKCDDFKMYPSQRVWYSIYNNVHPGRRWPSIAMSIAVVGILLVAGYFNTTKTTSQLSDSLQKETIIGDNKPVIVFEDAGVSQKQIVTPLINAKVSENKIQKTMISSPWENIILNEKFEQKSPFSIIERDNKTLFVKNVALKSNLFNMRDPKRAASQKELELIGGNEFMQRKSDSRINNIQSSVVKIVSTENIPAKENIEISSTDNNVAALYNNKPSRKKWVDKLEFQVYATPSVVYSQQSANTPFEENNLQRSILVTEDANGNIEHKPALGLEAGAAMQYSLTDIIKVKAGLQLNYTNYHIDAYESNHSVSSALKLNDFNNQTTYLYYSTSSVSNIPGGYSLTLSNKTYQLSLPVGVEFKVAGNEDLQLNIGATIQPTFLLGDNAYLISADKRNYINTPSLLNQWNINAGFETFISYKVNGITWQLGPQFRRQLSSSYDKKYTVNENLNNYGLKVGISRTIQ